MELAGTKRKRVHKVIVSNALEDVYSDDLQLYQLPPEYEVQLSEFEELAVERVVLFKILEEASQMGCKLLSNDWKESICADLNRYNLKHYYRLAKSPGVENPNNDDFQARRADHISHFILRLAYCRTDYLRTWFLTRELEWFKLRFIDLSPESFEKFFEKNNFSYTPVSEQEKSELYEELHESTLGGDNVQPRNFYKVKFTDVIPLVKERGVFFRNGFAYIPSYELITCASGIFRTSLHEALVYANKNLPHTDDDRINFLISNLDPVYTGRNYTEPNDSRTISISDIDSYVRQHFPLCMQHMHDILKRDHHLKHWCRLQLGLFLKGIGLTLGNAMKFWKEELTKKMDDRTFEKRYAYHINHIYGKAGKMFNYSPYCCFKIINFTVGTGEHHGCPFKHWDSNTLKAKLLENGLLTDDVKEIVETAARGQFQVACSKYFKYRHDQAKETIISHPNQYFEESLSLIEGEKDNSPVYVASKLCGSRDDSSLDSSDSS